MVPPRLRNHSRDDSEALEENVIFRDATPTPPHDVEVEIDPILSLRRHSLFNQKINNLK